MNLINKICIKIFCKKVGNDEFGNEYFKNKNGKRFVAYNGAAEPSKIPFEWHGWMHYTTDEIPVNIHKFSWQKIHLPNLTGTQYAYSPDQSSDKKTSSTYEAWKPNS
jgi:NADH:ubiquinone oxidoreductase subunit